MESMSDCFSQYSERLANRLIMAQSEYQLWSGDEEDEIEQGDEQIMSGHDSSEAPTHA